jgi:NAD-dependent deacetylase
MSAEKLRELIEKSDYIVFFGGAGVSTESNIPDFRSESGLYAAKTKYGFSPEELLSHSFFMRHTDVFYDYYKSCMIYKDAKPNKAHLALAELERRGKLKAVITQNIDGLHQAAGSKNVLELHGSVLRNYCVSCGKFFDLDYILSHDGVPKCDACGKLVKPDVVLYEESLNQDVLSAAVGHLRKADMLIVGGTSLVVYPAAGLIRYYSGDRLALINKSPTQYDSSADLLISDSVGKVLSEAVF